MTIKPLFDKVVVEGLKAEETKRLPLAKGSLLVFLLFSNYFISS